MNSILRHWTKLGRANRVAFFRTVADNLAETPSPLPNPNPPLAEYEAAVAAAEGGLQTIASLEQELESARQAVVPLIDAASMATEKMARRAEDTLGTDAAAIVAIGFKLTSGSPQPGGPMTMPEELTVSPGDNDGELDWQVRPVAGANGYEARTTAAPTDANSWTPHTVVTRSSGTLTGLPSGTRQYVQVRAIGPQGPGPWSDVATKMVP